MWRRLGLIVSLLAVVGLWAGQAQPAEASQRDRITVTTLTRGRSITTPVWGNGQFLILGEEGSILRSGDGQTWEEFPIPPGLNLYQLVFAKGQFYAVGTYWTWTSKDGLDWKRVDMWHTATHLMVTGDHLFANTKDGVFRLEVNGQWTQILNKAVESLASLGELVVATTNVGRSRDLIIRYPTGESATVPVPEGGTAVGLVAGDGQVLLSTGESGRAIKLWSTSDGRSWKLIPLPKGITSWVGEQVTYQEGRFWISDTSYSSDKTRLFSGTPEAGWRDEELPVQLDFFDPLVFAGGQRLFSHDEGLYRRGSDGTWSLTALGNDHTWRGLMGLDGVWIASTNFDGLLSSTDGRSWSPVQPKLTGFAWQNNSRVLVKDCLATTCLHLFVTADGHSWTDYKLPSSYVSTAGWTGNEVYVVDNINGVVSFSDGPSWRRLKSANPVRDAVFFKGALYLLIEENKTVVVYRSTDLETLVDTGQHLPFNYYALAASEDRLIISLASYSGFQETTNGIDWPFRKLPTGAFSVTPVGPFLVASGPLVGTHISRDGVNWWLVDGSPGGREAWNGQHMLLGGLPGRVVRWTPPAGDNLSCVPSFTDLDSKQPYCRLITKGAVEGLWQGVGDGLFAPDQPITRAAFITMLVRAMGWTPRPDERLSFTDVASHWAATGGYLQVAVDRGLIGGFPDGRFEPDWWVTRADALKIVTATLGKRPSEGVPYLDTPPGAWYTGWVAAARMARLAGPDAPATLWADVNLEPGRVVTRSEAAVLIYNLIDR
jgi:hypothetical protein